MTITASAMSGWRRFKFSDFNIAKKIILKSSNIQHPIAGEIPNSKLQTPDHICALL
jgi:hypothetical protein